MLSIQNLSFSYDSDRSVLKQISFDHKKGEIISLLGPSGCGKSTLLRLIGDLEKPNGAITWDEDIKAQKAFVFQDAALLPWKTVGDNIALPIQLAGDNVDRADIDKILQSIDLIDFEHRYPKTLSGGQKMRVSIARAIASKAGYLLMDEPFAALDEILRFKMNDFLLKLSAENKWSVLFVTHSIYEAAYISDRVLVMKDGRIDANLKIDLDRTISPAEQRSSAIFLDTVATISRALGA